LIDQHDSQWVKAGRFAALGTEFGATVVAGVVLGYYLDDWLGTAPLFILLGSVGALAGSVWRMTVMLKRIK